MTDTNADLSEDIKSYISVNDVLLTRSMDDENPGNYYCRINDVSQGKIVVTWPTSRGIRLLAHRDQIYNFSFVRDGVPHSFTGLIDETELEPLPQLKLILCSSINRVQRRDNYRIKSIIPVEIYGSVIEHTPVETVSMLNIKTTTYDLSAGGLSFIFGKLIPEGTMLELKLSLPDDMPVIKAPCRVIYSDSLVENPSQYKTGVVYLMISEWEKARIVRFVYRTQLAGLR